MLIGNILHRPGQFPDNIGLYAIRNGDYTYKIGDVFTRAVQYKYQKYPDYDKPPEVIKEKQTKIKILSFSAYDEDLDIICSGITGVVMLECLDGNIDWLNNQWCFE